MNPAANEWKLVTCCQGSVWDVAVDARRDSPSFGSWQSATLSSSQGNYALIPPGWAHGFISLEDNSVLAYSMSVEFDSALEIGFRWDSPSFNIEWPLKPLKVSEKDQSFARV